MRSDRPPLFTISLRTTRGSVEIQDSASQALGKHEVEALQIQTCAFLGEILSSLESKGWSANHLHVHLRLNVDSFPEESES
jgi:hypothetical protein